MIRCAIAIWGSDIFQSKGVGPLSERRAYGLGRSYALEGPTLETLRPVYTSDVCCDLSPFDACD